LCSVEPGRGATAQPGGEQTACADTQTHRRDCEAALLQQDRGRGQQAPGGQDQTSAPEQVCMLLLLHFGTDPDPRIHTSDNRIQLQLWILLFLPVTFKYGMPTKTYFFLSYFLLISF